jgi:hypothetical protein
VARNLRSGLAEPLQKQGKSFTITMQVLVAKCSKKETIVKVTVMMKYMKRNDGDIDDGLDAVLHDFSKLRLEHIR